MERTHPISPMAFAALPILLILCSASTTAVAKSNRPITDAEIREKKSACYADIERYHFFSFSSVVFPSCSCLKHLRWVFVCCGWGGGRSGLWGWQCRSSMIAKENCALRCLSPACYELIYESDPLEEGELDYIRSQEYKYCMHKFSIGDSLDGVKGSFNY